MPTILLEYTRNAIPQHCVLPQIWSSACSTHNFSTYILYFINQIELMMGPSVGPESSSNSDFYSPYSSLSFLHPRTCLTLCSKHNIYMYIYIYIYIYLYVYIYIYIYIYIYQNITDITNINIYWIKNILTPKISHQLFLSNEQYL